MVGFTTPIGRSGGWIYGNSSICDALDELKVHGHDRTNMRLQNAEHEVDMNNLPALLRMGEVLYIFDLSKSVLARWIAQGKFPKPNAKSLDGTKRYTKELVLEYLNERGEI